MKPKSNRFIVASFVAFVAFTHTASAVDVSRADSATLLDLGTSWGGGTAPSSGDVATFSGTYNTAGSLSTAFTASTPVSWQGIKIGVISGTAAGLVSIGGTAAATAGSSVTIGSSGIDMSTSGGANQNLVINAVTTVLGSSQTWNIGAGRNLRFGSTGTGSYNSNIDGGAGVVVTVQGGGLVDLNSNGTAPFGMAGYGGKWVVNTGTTLRNISNFATAFGTNTAADTITLSGGTLAVGGISGSQGNWSWNSKMTLADSTASSIDNQLFSGTNRWLKLESEIAGGALNLGTLTFKNTNPSQMNSDEHGYILSGANTFTGGMTINASTYVRIGGSAAGTTNPNAGNNGSLASGLGITDNGVLRLTRNDEWTLANNITGSGQLKIGGTLGTTSSQVVTVSGANTYSGATTVVNGKLNLTGSLTSAINVTGTSTLSGTGSTTGLLTTAAGTSIALAGGATTTSLTVKGATFSGATTVTFDTAPISGTVYDVLTYGGVTGVTNPGNLAVPWRGTLADDTVNKKYTFTAAAASTRTWNIATGTWDQNVTANWAEGDQKFVGGDSVIFNEPASPSTVTLAGFINPSAVAVNNTTNDYTFSGAAITGNTGLTKSGAGTLKLTSANTYTGGTTLTAGSIVLTNGSALGSTGSIALNSPATGASNASLLVDASGGSVTFARPLTIANEGSGTTTVGSSLFTVNTQQALFSGAITLAKDVSLVGVAGGDRTQFSGGISGTGNVKVTGAGRVLFLSTANTYVGTTVIDGILQLSDGTATTNSFIPDASNVTVNSGGYLRLAKGTNSETIGGLNGLGIVESNAGNNTLIVGGGDAAGSFSGVLQNNGVTLALTKTGSGTQTLVGLNTYTGATTINGGTLQIGDNGAAGQLAAASAVTNNASLSFKRSDSVIVANAISGTGGVTQDGSGTTTLTGALSYTGATTVTAGKLFVNTAGTSGSAYTVNSGTTLGGDNAVSALTVNNGGSLTLGNGSGTGTLTANTLTLGSVGGDSQTINTTVSSSALNVVNSDGLVNNGTTTFACTGAALSTAGTYPLATYVGTLGGAGSFALALPPRIAATLDQATPGQINLVVSGADTIKWTGASNGLWNTSSLNWKQIIAGTSTAFIDGSPGDTVTFDDSASGTTAVTLDSTSSPALVTVNNTTKSYSITGSGKITGATTALVKNGSNTLTLGTSGGNDYAGGTTVNEGTLKLGAADVLPTAGALSLTGTLDLNASNQTVAALTGAGTVTNSGSSSATFTVANPTNATSGAVIQNGASATAFTKSGLGVLTLTADNTYTGETTISAGTLELGANGITGGLSATTAITNNGLLRINRSDEVTLGNTISGSGGITQFGDGNLNLNGANSYAGGTTISRGTITLGTATALGSGSVSLNVGTLAMNGQSIANAVVQGGGSITGTGTIGGSVTGSDLSYSSSGNSLTLSGANTAAATVNAGTLILTGSNTSATASTGAEGTLQVGAGGTTGIIGAVTNAGLLVFNRSDALTYTGAISGAGSVQQSGAGTLTFSNAKAYSGSTNVSDNCQLTVSSTLLNSSGFNVGTGATLELNAINVFVAGHGTALPASRVLAVNGGTLRMNTAFEARFGNVSLANGATWTSNRALTSYDALLADTTTGPATVTVSGTGTSYMDGSGGIHLQGVQNFDVADVTGSTDLDLIVSMVLSTTGTSGGTVGGINKLGAGTMLLTRNNTYAGNTTISAGTLEVGNGGVTGSMGSGAVTNTVTNNAALVLNYGYDASINLGNVISGTGTLTKEGDGLVALTGLNTYSGATTVNQGSLKIGNHIDSTDVTVQGYATIGAGSPSTAGSGWVKSLTLASDSASSFRVGATSDQLVVNDADGLVINGPHVVTAVSTGGLNSGETVAIIDYTGNLGGGGFANLSLAPGSRFTLTNNTVNTTIDLTYTGGILTWKGNLSTDWDLDTTANWTLGGNAANFLTGDFVLFNDSASTGSVVLTDTLTPSSVTINNSALAYELSGGSLAGTGPVNKLGSGTATITSYNTYSGATSIGAGTLIFGDGATSGEIGTGAVDILSGGTLRINRSDLLNYKSSARLRTITGAGNIVVDGGGTLFNYTGSGIGFTEESSWVGFSGNLTVRGGSEFETIRNGATAMGTGTVILGDATTSGNLSQIEGNWTWTNNISLVGSANKILNRSQNSPRTLKLQGVITGSGGLRFEDPALSMLNINRGFILTGANTMSGTLTIPAGVPVRVGGSPGDTDVSQSGAGLSGSLGSATVVNDGTLTFSRTDAHTVSNAISGTGALRVGIPVADGFGDTTTQVLTFTSTASHTGATTVNNGTLIVGAGGSMGGSSVTVDATGTLGGGGTVTAPLTAAGTIAPGVGVGILTVGDTVLTGTYLCELDGASADNLAAGTLNVTGSTLTFSTVNAPSGSSYTIATYTGTLGGTFTSTTVPDGYALDYTTAGQVKLVKLVVAGYSAWATTNAGGQAASLDFDNDGVSNGVEYFMGETGSSFTKNPEVVNGAVTWKRDPNAAASFKVQISETLGAWTDIVPPNASINETNPNQVTYTLPTGSEKKFCRLQVVVPQ